MDGIAAVQERLRWLHDRLRVSLLDGWATEVKKCADALDPIREAIPAPQQQIANYLSHGGLFNPESMEHQKVRDLLMATRDTASERVIHLDMLQVDRLRTWADKIELHGADISHWGDPTFVREEMRRIAQDIEDQIKSQAFLRDEGGDPQT